MVVFSPSCNHHNILDIQVKRLLAANISLEVLRISVARMAAVQHDSKIKEKARDLFNCTSSPLSYVVKSNGSVGFSKMEKTKPKD